MGMSVDYLLRNSSKSERNYAKSAASDGIITYSVSNDHGEIKKNWIRRTYEYLTSILNIDFQEVSGDGEFRFDVQIGNLDDDLYEGSELDQSVVGLSGDISWKSWHDKKQYGGVRSQRKIVHTIGRSLGLSYPNDDPWNKNYTTDSTIISLQRPETHTNLGNLGNTIFFTDDDQNALKTIFGANSSDVLTGQNVNHVERIEEDLLIGRNGQVDNFYLVSKGINYSNSAAKYVEPNGRIWNNDYIIPSIANFNPHEGDRIMIKRRLFLPSSPIDSSTSNKSLPKKFKFNGKKVKTKKFLKKVKINFADHQNSLNNDRIFSSKVNLHVNDAGKILINANGTSPNLGPHSDDISVNGQLLGFLDVYGPFGSAIQGDWFGLF
jgi:hypothetical protein